MIYDLNPSIAQTRYVTILRVHSTAVLSLPASRGGHAAAARVDHLLGMHFEGFVFESTLTFQIGVHIRLFIFRKKSPLYDLIRVYTFIRFEANPPYTIFIWYVRLLS